MIHRSGPMEPLSSDNHATRARGPFGLRRRPRGRTTARSGPTSTGADFFDVDAGGHMASLASRGRLQVDNPVVATKTWAALSGIAASEPLD